jgi:hypothetical protein
MVALIVVVLAVAAATAARRDIGGAGWVAVVCIGLGVGTGIAYARSRRGWADYRYTRRQVPILRRSFLGNAGRLLFWSLLVGGVLLIAMSARGR